MRKRAVALVLTAAVACNLAGCGGTAATKNETTKSDTAQSETTKEAGAQTEESKSEAAQTPAEGEVVIKYWYPWGGDSETWDLWRIEEFEKNNPGIKVEATYVPPDAGITNGKLMAAIASGNVPDVICAPNLLTYPMAAQGAFEDVSAAMEKLGRSRDDYQPSVQSLMDIDGAWYIMPMETDTQMLFINNEKAAAAGLDVSNPPKSISELDEWADKMTVKEGDDYTTMGFIPWIDGAETDVYNQAWYFGAQIYEDGKINLTDPDLVEMMNWQRKYAEKYNPEKIKSFASGFGGAFSPDHAFFTGKVAMTMNGNWFNNAIRQYVPDMDYTVVPMVVSDSHPELYGGSVLGVNTYCVPKGAKNIDAAARFVDYIANAYIADDNNKTWYSTPTRKDVIDELTLVKENDERYSVIKNMVFNEHSNTPALCSIRSVMGQELISVRDKCLYEDKDPEPLLTDLQGRMEKELQNTQ